MPLSEYSYSHCEGDADADGDYCNYGGRGVNRELAESVSVDGSSEEEAAASMEAWRWVRM